MTIILTSFETLQEKHFGKLGTPNRNTYEEGFKKEINRLTLTRMLKKIKGKANRQ